MVKAIDVVIPTFGRALRVRRLVERITCLLGENDTVYVVWQGKDKPDITQSNKVKLLHSSPPNLPKARNMGILAGTGEIVLFLDDDVEVLDERLLDAHRHCFYKEEIGAVAGYINDELFDAAQTIPSRFDETTGELVQNFSCEKSQYSFSVMGANMSFLRKALVQAGGFDESFVKNALWEEVDCALRIKSAGWKIWFCSAARVLHTREAAGGCRGRGAYAYCFYQFYNTAYFAGRYAPTIQYSSWFTYWKYRLEYVSRKKMVWLTHDPILVVAGIAGACAGMIHALAMGKKMKRAL